ncbi:MAG: SxtJ family membrane protein [Hyphomicrobiaceae bacterium]
MASSDLATHHQTRIGSERNFGIVFAVVFSIIGLWPMVFGSGGIRLWSILVGSAFLAFAFLRPGLLKPLNVAWFRLGILLGRVVSPVVMALVFFGVVTPTAVALRLSGKDPLRLKKAPAGQQSYWIDRLPADPDSASMKNQF